MAYSNSRGARYDVDVLASVGVNDQWTINDSDDNPFDLTGYTVSAKLKDDESGYVGYGSASNCDQSFTMTVTDAAAGQFDFIIPSSAFAGREGGCLTYELFYTDGAGENHALAHGYINVLERG